MTIHEPGTLISDCLLAAISTVLAWRLKRGVRPEDTAARGWVWTLVLVAVSALTGGISHGFGPELPAAVAALLWRATLWTLSCTAAAMAWSLVDELVVVDRRRGWRSAIAAKAGLFVAIATVTPEFLVPIVDYGSVLLAWLIAAALCRRAWRGWMTTAVTMSIGAALVQQVGPDLATHFNHNDLYHAIQAVALYSFYRGARLFGGATAPMAGAD